MKRPDILVAAALTAAILLTASLLIVTGTRGEDVLWLHAINPPGRIVLTPPPAK